MLLTSPGQDGAIVFHCSKGICIHMQLRDPFLQLALNWGKGNTWCSAEPKHWKIPHLIPGTLTLAVSLHLKMDGWKMIVSFWECNTLPGRSWVIWIEDFNRLQIECMQYCSTVRQEGWEAASRIQQTSLTHIFNLAIICNHLLVVISDAVHVRIPEIYFSSKISSPHTDSSALETSWNFEKKNIQKPKAKTPLHHTYQPRTIPLPDLTSADQESPSLPPSHPFSWKEGWLPGRVNSRDVGNTRWEHLCRFPAREFFQNPRQWLPVGLKTHLDLSRGANRETRKQVGTHYKIYLLHRAPELCVQAVISKPQSIKTLCQNTSFCAPAPQKVLIQPIMTDKIKTCLI